MALLPSAVEAMYTALASFLAEFDAFLHDHVASVVGYHVGGAVGGSHHGSGAPAAARGSSGRAHDGPARVQHAADPIFALSNLDSLVFNTIAFGLQQLVAAVGDIARTTRRTRHAEMRAGVFT